MYRLYFNEYPLHDLRSEDLLLRDPEVRLAVDEAGEIAFTIDPEHPYADQITRMKGTVRLLAGSSQLFLGRVKKDTRDFSLSRRIEVEGLLACLNDSVIPPHTFPDDFLGDAAYQIAAESGSVVQFYLEWLLGQHNAQVGPDQQVKLGEVTVSDPNNYIHRSSSDYLTTMETVKKKLRDLLGGYLLADYSGSTTVLHYYADLPLTNIQEVEFAKNLLDLEVELDASETYTAILPVGKDGLTIEGLEDREVSPGFIKTGAIIYSVAAEAEIGGRITRKVDWEDVTEPTNLLNKAAAHLATEGVKHVQAITCKAVDLGFSTERVTTGEGDSGTSAVAGLAVAGMSVVGSTATTGTGGAAFLANFRVGRYVQLKSPPHGFAAAYPLMELEPNLLDPADTTITLGSTIKTSSDIAHQNKSDFEEQMNQQKIELNQKTENMMTDMVEVVRNQATEVLHSSERIIMSALETYAKTSDLDSFKKTIDTQFSIMSGEISMKFTQVSEHIVNVDGDLQKTVEALTKHFDFGLDGLGIRGDINAMTLRLDNDLIIFEKNGHQFGWWDGVDFHTGNIVIDVTERAQFGNFAYVPRSNGSLDFLKVGG